MLRRRRRTSEANTSADGLLPVGTPAPDFTLSATTGEALTLSDHRGRPVVLVFYPADWSTICGDQLALYNEVYPLFEEHQAQVLAISVDGIWSHREFAKSRNLRFPLLADFHPKGFVARACGAYDSEAGVARRALFVLDQEGIIRWNHLSPAGVNPGANGILNALESLSTE